MVVLRGDPLSLPSVPDRASRQGAEEPVLPGRSLLVAGLCTTAADTLTALDLELDAKTSILLSWSRAASRGT